MAKFGKLSWDRLQTVHPDLQLLFQEVVKTYDCAILTGHRDKTAQEEAFHTGKSEKNWPDSLHNKWLSQAVDVAPWPIDWNDTKRFYHFAGFVQATAQMMGIKIRWGGDWDSDRDFKDQTFNDLVHFELGG